MRSFKALKMDFPNKITRPREISSNISFKQQLDAVKVPIYTHMPKYPPFVHNNNFLEPMLR
jgi:hypothetical protein